MDRLLAGVPLWLCIGGDLQAAVQGQLLQDVVHVALDGMAGGLESLGNLLVAEAFPINATTSCSRLVMLTVSLTAPDRGGTHAGHLGEDRSSRRRREHRYALERRSVWC
jgi:hypothetical protein